MKMGSKLLLFCVLSSWSFALDAQADDERRDGEPLRCLSLSRIDHTEIIDNHSIAFFLKGGDIYLNRLQRACPGLRPGQAFSYRTGTGRLCNVDTIRVLENYGLGLSLSAACGLGPFTPIGADALAVLKGEYAGPEEDTITVIEVEVEE